MGGFPLLLELGSWLDSLKSKFEEGAKSGVLSSTLNDDFIIIKYKVIR